MDIETRIARLERFLGISGEQPNAEQGKPVNRVAYQSAIAAMIAGNGKPMAEYLKQYDTP